MPDQNPPGEVTPLSLLGRARANDQQAWARLAALYQPLVLFWCRRAGCPPGDAEDVAQETFAGVAAGLGGFRRDRAGDSFRGWLRGITRNQLLLHFRRNRGRPRPVGGSDALGRLNDLPDTVADPLPDDATAAEGEALQVRELYRRAVAHVRGEFESRTWDIFWRAVIDGRSAADVADELGTTPAAVRQAKSRVLRRLKQELGELID